MHDSGAPADRRVKNVILLTSRAYPGAGRIYDSITFYFCYVAVVDRYLEVAAVDFGLRSGIYCVELHRFPPLDEIGW